VVPGRLLLDQAKQVDRATYLEQVSRLAPEPGDILYTREGERFGLAAVVPNGVQLCMSQRMMLFRVQAGIVPEFFMWALNSPIGYSQALEDVGGSTSPHVNIGSIRAFHLPIAPESEQAAIAQRIERAWSQADSRCASVEELLETISRFEQCILAKAFRGALVPQEESCVPAHSMRPRFKIDDDAPTKESSQLPVSSNGVRNGVLGTTGG
jgi:type I restriction enzyme, S subunit